MDEQTRTGESRIHGAVREAPGRPVVPWAPCAVEESATGLRRVAVLGNHLPRQCGIATFTTDLSEAITAERPALDCFVLAMNEAGRHHTYPERVRFEIAATDQTSYREAADFLNLNEVDLLSLQHEYGIFGGDAGQHVLALLRELRLPIVTTLHTILPKSLEFCDERRVMDELTEISTRLIVMSTHGAELLREVHGVPESKIDVIPSRHSGSASIRAGQACARARGSFGHPHVWSAVRRQGHRAGRRRASGHPGATPRDSLYRARGHPPARQGEVRRGVSDYARRPRPIAPHHRERRVSQPLRQQGRACGVPLRRRCVHHPVPQPGTDHLGHAGVRGRHR